MIGKVMIGKSFRGCISYCMENKKQKISDNINTSQVNRAEVLLFNQCYGNTKEVIQQFNETRQLNPKFSKPVLHITLSLAPGEKLERGNLIEMIQDCAKDFGFENNQFIAISHSDTSHQHLHIVVNRIGFDKKTVSDSNSYKKIAAYCRQMEVKYNLQQVLLPKTYTDFEGYMKQKKYQIIKARGIAFIDEKGVYIKGSSLGYSLATIQKILQQSPAQKQALISGEQQRDNNFKKQWQHHSLFPKKNLSKEIKTGVNKTLDILLKPEITNNNIPFLLIKKKEKKKRNHLSI